MKLRAGETIAGLPPTRLSPNGIPAMIIDLCGDWTLRSAGGLHVAPMTLPGDGVSALRDAGIIADPYIGMNEVAARWVCEQDWTARRDFSLAAGLPDQGWYLDIENLDTVCEIRLNGELVLNARNCFRRYRPDVSAALRHGANTIEILFRSSILQAAAEQGRQPFFVPYHAGNSPIPHGNMLRKPQCHFGWDWNLAVPPFGVYSPLVLRNDGKARIETVRVTQVHDADAVEVEVSVDIVAITAGTVPLRAGFAGEEQLRLVTVREGRQTERLTFTVLEPRLWWPNGWGEQPLYDLTIGLGEASERRRIGLRRIEHVTSPDDVGARFLFRVNGREIFCRGANWIPADALPSGATPALLERLLVAARDANMNMIRVWGGGFYESERFYDLCDELGLLVWQDFQFACNLYPSTPDFLAEVRAEVHDQVARLQHRACLALWCGDNELIGALTWFEESRKDRDRYLVSYDRLNRTIETALKEVDGNANWWPSSPSPGVLRFGDAWHDDRSGDMHYWDVWHAGKPFEAYRTIRPRFCSEFGFQSFPSLAVIRRFAEEEDFNIAAPVMEAHQKNAGGNARITETLFRNFRFPKDFGNFVYLSQIQQGLAMKTAVDFWRSLKPHCMGTLYWQLNDTWPVASWSGLDHGGGWKALHYLARRFFAPLTVVAIPDGGRLDFHGLNDLLRSESVELAVHAVRPCGEQRLVCEAQTDVAPDRACMLASLDLVELAEDEILFFWWLTGSGETGCDHFAPRPYKHYRFQPPAIDMAARQEASGTVVTLSAQRPALFVMLEAQLSGRFEDNVVDLMPGRPVSLRFLPAEGVDAAALADGLVLRSLQDSYAIEGMRRK